MPSIAELKAESDALLGQMKDYVSNNREAGKFYDQDDRAWHLGTNQTKSGAAKIRLLPNAEGDKTNLEVLPAARYYSHSFQNKGGWYIENSLRTIGKPDPVDDYVKWIKNNTDEDVDSSMFRRTRYVVNIFVYEDMVDGKNNGKHFLWHMPKTLYAMVADKISPPAADVDKFTGPREPVNVFDFWNGCDFVVGRFEKKGWTDYKENSNFLGISPINLVPGNEQGNDEAIADLYKKLYPMSEFIDPNSKWYKKTYNQLHERLQTVLAKDLGFLIENRPVQVAVPQVAQTSAPELVQAAPQPQVQEQVPATPRPAPELVATDPAEKNALAFFHGLAKDD